MKIDVSDPGIAALLRADGIGRGGSGRTLYVPDPAMPLVGRALRGLRWLAGCAARSTRAGAVIVHNQLKRRTRHGAS